MAGALGDAWGSAYEGRVGPIAAPFPERPRLSDDTWLTVATCEAIVRAGGHVDPSGIAESFRAWFEHGRLRGLGSSTLKALRDLAAGAHWALSPPWNWPSPNSSRWFVTIRRASSRGCGDYTCARNATMGSTCEARRAGRYVATIVIPASAADTAA